MSRTDYNKIEECIFIFKYEIKNLFKRKYNCKLSLDRIRLVYIVDKMINKRYYDKFDMNADKKTMFEFLLYNKDILYIVSDCFDVEEDEELEVDPDLTVCIDFDGRSIFEFDPYHYVGDDDNNIEDEEGDKDDDIIDYDDMGSWFEKKLEEYDEREKERIKLFGKVLDEWIINKTSKKRIKMESSIIRPEGFDDYIRGIEY